MTPTEAQRLSEQAKRTPESELAKVIAEKLLSVGHHSRCLSRRGESCNCYQRRADYILARCYLDLFRQLAEAKRAARLADKDASVAHDAMWAMDMATILAGPTRTAFEFHRKAASDAIWKIHERLRALNTDDCQQSSPKDSGESSTDRATTGVEGAPTPLHELLDDDDRAIMAEDRGEGRG